MCGSRVLLHITVSTISRHAHKYAFTLLTMCPCERVYLCIVWWQRGVRFFTRNASLLRLLRASATQTYKRTCIHGCVL